MDTNRKDNLSPSPSGANAVVLVTGGETGGLYSVVALTLPPHDRGVSLHNHPHYGEGLYVVAGTLAVTRADEMITLPPGDSLLVRPGERHSCWNPIASATTVLLVYRPGVSEAEAISLALGASGFT
jgi:quercetin dioxygenase-like cupin family protein